MADANGEIKNGRMTSSKLMFYIIIARFSASRVTKLRIPKNAGQ
jgi:hypothetical protein